MRSPIAIRGGYGDGKSIVFEQLMGAVNIFGIALQREITNPAVGNDPIDLTVRANWDAIHDALIRIIRDCRLYFVGWVSLVSVAMNADRN